MSIPFISYLFVTSKAEVSLWKAPYISVAFLMIVGTCNSITQVWRLANPLKRSEKHNGSSWAVSTTLWMTSTAVPKNATASILTFPFSADTTPAATWSKLTKSTRLRLSGKRIWSVTIPVTKTLSTACAQRTLHAKQVSQSVTIKACLSRFPPKQTTTEASENKPCVATCLFSCALYQIHSGYETATSTFLP